MPPRWQPRCVAPADLVTAVADGRVLVAVDASDRAVGFAYLLDVLGEAHLEELDVVPEHGRKGLGTALVEAACEWARAHGHSALSLCTYRDIPFNAPFYTRHGFRPLEPEEWSAAHRATVERETAKGYEMPRRLMMLRRLS